MSEKTYEMMWDCEYCRTPKLLGKTHRHCPECGAAQNPEKRYFPPEEEKVAVEDHQYVGADVHCPACRAAQSAAAKCCGECGSPMEAGRAATLQAEQVVGAGGAPAPAAGAKAESKGGRGRYILAAIVVVILGVIGFFVVNRFWTQSAAFEVTDLTWKREIDVETYSKVKESGPCKSVPAGASITGRSTPKPVCKTRKVDQGDGTYKEKQECTSPVEQCDYTATKWKVTSSVKEQGAAAVAPKWPVTRLRRKSSRPRLGDKAEGARRESYVVKLRDRKSRETHDCAFSSEQTWRGFAKGSRWTGETGMLTGDVKCDKLRRAK